MSADGSLQESSNSCNSINRILFIFEGEVGEKEIQVGKTWVAERNTFGHMPSIDELRNEPQDFRNYLQMSHTDFDHLPG